MKLLFKSMLTLGLLTATAALASAEFAEPSSDQGHTSAIELENSDPTSPDHFGKMLDSLTPAGLSESVLARHLRAALPANGPQSTAGDSVMGSENPMLLGDSSASEFNRQHPADKITPFGDSIAAAGGTLSLAGAAAISASSHYIGSGYVTAAAPQVVASSSAPITVSGNSSGTPVTSSTVPLPPAALLFASGLLGLPLTRRMKIGKQGR